jgi:hypothetical protein
MGFLRAPTVIIRRVDALLRRGEVFGACRRIGESRLGHSAAGGWTARGRVKWHPYIKTRRASTRPDGQPRYSPPQTCMNQAPGLRYLPVPDMTERACPSTLPTNWRRRVSRGEASRIRDRCWAGASPWHGRLRLSSAPPEIPLHLFQ